jgi:hypothetical protein
LVVLMLMLLLALWMLLMVLMQRRYGTLNEPDAQWRVPTVWVGVARIVF